MLMISEGTLEFPAIHNRKTRAIEERISEKNMNVTLRRALTVGVLALILAAMWAGAASAVPSTVDPDTLTPVPPPGAQCKDTGNYVICQTFGGETWANEPDFTLSCGRAYTTGSAYREGIRWYSDGLLVRRSVKETGADTISLSPSGEGPTVRFDGHFNYTDYLATPGDFDSATTIEHGLDSRMWRPGSGVMLQLAGIFIFAPEGVTHRGAGEFALDEEGNLIIPPKADAALCEALQP
jgi:hypothetical protein